MSADTPMLTASSVSMSSFSPTAYDIITTVSDAIHSTHSRFVRFFIGFVSTVKPPKKAPAFSLF